MAQGFPCYFGCGNIGNKIVWAAFAVSVALGLGLIIGGAVDGKDCLKQFQNCRNNGGSQDYCQQLYNSECNLSKYQGIVGSGIVILFLVAPLLTIYFCCWSIRPDALDQAEVVLVSAVPVPGSAPYRPPPPGYMPYGPYPPPPPPVAYPYYPQPGQSHMGAGPSVVQGIPYPPVKSV